VDNLVEQGKGKQIMRKKAYGHKLTWMQPTLHHTAKPTHSACGGGSTASGTNGAASEVYCAQGNANLQDSGYCATGAGANKQSSMCYAGATAADVGCAGGGTAHSNYPLSATNCVTGNGFGQASACFVGGIVT
jgi:hypothetical protein